MPCRESDSSVVPMKLGNANGGRASYQLSPLLGKHLLHSEVGIINGNKTTKDSRIAKIEPEMKFTSLAHLLNEQSLTQCHQRKHGSVRGRSTIYRKVGRLLSTRLVK